MIVGILLIIHVVALILFVALISKETTDRENRKLEYYGKDKGTCPYCFIRIEKNKESSCTCPNCYRKITKDGKKAIQA